MRLELRILPSSAKLPKTKMLELFSVAINSNTNQLLAALPYVCWKVRPGSNHMKSQRFAGKAATFGIASPMRRAKGSTQGFSQSSLLPEVSETSKTTEQESYSIAESSISSQISATKSHEEPFLSAKICTEKNATFFNITT